MLKHDPRVDAYITKSADFAQPILVHLRALIHETCPEVEEDIKWGAPCFSYQGALMCTMAAFKRHCSFRFWLYQKVLGHRAEQNGMGQFGKLTSLQDLPSDKRLTTHIRKAMALSAAGVTLSRPGAVRSAPVVPNDLATRLAQKEHTKARNTWNAFGAGAQREYAEWIGAAKTDATRQKRLVTTLEWLAEGKRRHWKYAR